MENANSTLEQICRHQKVLRAFAIRSAIDGRRSSLAQVGGTLSDSDRNARDTAIRVFRAKGTGGSE